MSDSRRLFLREWRLACRTKKITQKALGKMSGRAHSAVSAVENGKRDYSGVNLEHWARALGCRPADLLCRRPSNFDDLKDFVVGAQDCGRVLIVNEKQLRQLIENMTQMLILAGLNPRQAMLAAERSLIAIPGLEDALPNASDLIARELHES